MLTYWKISIIVTLLLASVACGFAQGSEVFLREDFNALDNWKPLYFPKIKKHSIYSIEENNRVNYLKAESNASASGIILKKEFNVFQYTKIKWRWKISNVYEKGDARKQSGDDYPIRVYIIFKYNPDKATFGQRIKYGIARKIYGDYPPHSSLNYIWANIEHSESILTSTYANEAKLLILQTGSVNAGKWIEQEVTITEDYYRAFGEAPPETASIAIMSDSDNTGERAAAFIDYIEVYR